MQNQKQLRQWLNIAHWLNHIIFNPIPGLLASGFAIPRVLPVVIRIEPCGFQWLKNNRKAIEYE